MGAGRGAFGEDISRFNMRKIFQLLLRIAVSGLALFLILRQVNLLEVLTYLKGANLIFLVASVGLIFLHYFISSYRWQGLARVKGIDISLFALVRLYFIGAFFNNFLPSIVGGDVVKAYKLTQMTEKKVDAAVSVFMDRFTGLVILVLISGVAFLYQFKLLAVGVSVALFLLGVLGIWLAPKLARLHPLLRKAYDSVMAYRGEREVLWRAAWTSFVVQVVAVTTEYLIFLALGIKVSYLYCLFALPLISVASMLPLSINGVGVQDALFVLFFSRVGVAQEAALAVSFVYHTLRLGSSLTGGVLYFFGR